LIPERLAKAAKRFNLTARESQTLALLALGHPWKAVACEMDVTIHTVRFHAHNILVKVQGSNLFACFAKLFLQ
jgi:DNA-binding CsgD family transcriptional regulator